MLEIGFMHYTGSKNLPQNKKLAAQWFRKSADIGNAVAMNNLGFMYENGDGVQFNKKLADEYKNKAKAAGYSPE